MYIGSAILVSGDIATAEQELEKSLLIFREMNLIYLALAHAVLGMLFLQKENIFEAQTHLHSAMLLNRKHRSITHMMYSLTLAALISAKGGKHLQAIELAAQAWRFDHVQRSRWFEDAAGKELQRARHLISRDETAAAELRGREGDVWEMADKIQFS